MHQANVFVVGLDEQNLETLREVPKLSEYRFHGLLSIPELQQGEIPVAELIEKAERQLEDFDGSVDAIVGYWDFPVSTMLPILCGRYSLPSASLEAVLKCEHKYWSRLEQRQVIDEHPDFALVALDDAAERPDGLKYPMWLKPVKSYSSDLAFRVTDDDEFQLALGKINDGIGRIGEPFQYILDQAELPADIDEIGAQAVLAEEAMSGMQAAVEGYSLDGRVEVYGALDSIDYPKSSSFLRHQYPSQLPGNVVRRMEDVAKRVISHIGLDNIAFSIEFFCDPDSGDVCLLEINPRHSQSHAELFEHVDGAPNHHCMLRLALGQEPYMPYREGDYGIAAKWIYRRFDGDAVVRRTPSREEIDQIERDIPGVAIFPTVSEGDRLDDLPGQDSYSYALADLIVGAADVSDLADKYHRATQRLEFEFDESDGG